MKQSPYEMLREFHAVMDPEKGSLEDKDVVQLRWDLIEEEVEEVYDELFRPLDPIDPVKLTKELADVMYVVIGCAEKFNLPLEQVFAEVHRSNMTKIQEDGTILRREDGKILKPDTYEAPNLEQFFKDV